VSAIGSVPEPMAGIDTGAQPGPVGGYEQVFSTASIAVGKSSFLASRRDATAVTSQLLDRYLGEPRNGPAQLERLLERVRARQAAVGYTMSYKEWLARVTPPAA
jgi:hypothetical protein